MYLDIMRHRDDSCLSHHVVLNKDRLDLGGGHEVAGAVEHVVNSPRDPDVPILVPLGSVPRHVVAGEPGEVGFLKPVLVPVHSPHDAGPGPVKHDVALGLTLEDLPGLAHDLRHHPEKRVACGPRLGGGAAGEGGEDVAPSLGLPVRVGDAALTSAHHPVVP